MKTDEASGESYSVPVVENENQLQRHGGYVQIHAPAPVPAPEAEPNDDLLRCRCGALLARWVAAGLELKCRRCKRTTLIPYPKRTSFTRAHPS